MQQLRQLLSQVQPHQQSGPDQARLPAADADASPSQGPAAISGQWLDVLAAEQERCAAVGMGEAACRFLAEARSHLRAAEVMQAQGAPQQQALLAGSPLHAVAAFILGPLVHAQQSGLQAVLAADACSFVCQVADTEGGDDHARAELQHLISGAEMHLGLCMHKHGNACACVRVTTMMSKSKSLLDRTHGRCHRLFGITCA